MAKRRDFLKAASATLVAVSAFPASAESRARDDAELYLHGLVWNTQLPGIFAELLLTFDVRIDLGTGTGLGTFRDDIHPTFNAHFAVESTSKHGSTRFLQGHIVRGNSPDMLGVPVSLDAEFRGQGTRVIVQLGGLVFSGAGFVKHVQVQ